MYKHILIPAEIGGRVDYAHASKVATSLLAEDGKITLLHAIEPIPIYAESYIPPDFQIKTRADVQENLDALASQLGIKNTALMFGSAGRSIVDWAEENSADCIVLASHRPAFTDLFLGSTAAWVVRHTKTSVHVLR